jgi:hypothetical protein
MRFLMAIFAGIAANCMAAGSLEVGDGSDIKGIWIENAQVRVECDRDAAHARVIDRRDGSLVIDDLSWWMSPPLATTVRAESSACYGTCGAGKELRLTRVRTDGLEEVLIVRLGRIGSFLEIGFKIVNHGGADTRVMEFGIQGRGFAGHDLGGYKTLDGESDGYATHVSEDGKREAYNNLLATFGLPGQGKHSLVIGGLRYQEFKRHCEISRMAGHLSFEVEAKDPVGKLVKAGTDYQFQDTIYIDAVTDNRFEALERYGKALAQANSVDLTVPNLPAINLWCAQDKRFGDSTFRNNTPGAVWVANDAKKTGFLKYSAIAVRLEPDDYSVPNNQQGWWDDEHFQRYPSGQFLPPYETAAKWGAAMNEAGATPFIYFQTARRSEDYCQKFPEQMLFKDPARARPQPLDWFKDRYWSYDFTEPGFMQHMRAVYANLRGAGVRGIKFDYPETGWDCIGGFDDASATTGSAYRNIFNLALDGLGHRSEVQERLCIAGDLTLGAITTMRIQDDTDKLYPPMVTKAGLRWYKNRVAVYYDLDVKNPNHAVPTDSIDGVRAMFTMMTVVSARLELANYLSELTPQVRRVISRVVPLYMGPRSARPVDAFDGREQPQVFDLEIQAGWHQLTFYNTSLEGESWPTEWNAVINPLHGRLVPAKVSVDLGRATDDGGLGLDTNKRYHVYDFWNDHYVGLFRGSDSLAQDLRAGEARMMSVHEALDHPQFLSTDRHVLQGVVDLSGCNWQPRQKRLVGTSRLVADEPYTVVIASNGYEAKDASATTAEASLLANPESRKLLDLTLLSHAGGAVDWQVTFK